MQRSIDDHQWTIPVSAKWTTKIAGEWVALKLNANSICWNNYKNTSREISVKASLFAQNIG